MYNNSIWFLFVIFVVITFHWKVGCESCKTLIYSPGGKDFYRNYILTYSPLIVKGASNNWPLLKYLNQKDEPLNQFNEIFIENLDDKKVSLHDAVQHKKEINEVLVSNSSLLNLIYLPFMLLCNEYLNNISISLHLHTNTKEKQITSQDIIIVPLNELSIIYCPVRETCQLIDVGRGDQFYLPIKSVYALKPVDGSTEVSYMLVQFSFFQMEFSEEMSTEEAQSYYREFLQKQPSSIECNNTKVTIKEALNIDFNDEEKILHLRIPKRNERPDDIILASGYKMPVFGLGTALLNETTYDAVKYALSIGYRLFDLAHGYPFSETGFAKALKESEVPRSNVFVVTKLQPRYLGYNETLHAIDLSLDNLQTKYIDLFLIHSIECDDFLLQCGEGEPKGTWKESWRAMEEGVKNGRIRSIGVSNFYKENLLELVKWSREPISVVQNWFDPFNQDLSTRNLCNQYNIRYMGYSTLGSRWKLLGMNFNPVLTSEVLSVLSGHHDYIVSHIVLRWAIHVNVTVIPRSGNPNHIAQNIRSLDIKLHPNDIEEINGMNAFGDEGGDDDNEDESEV